jgi:hypothetical protein
MTRGTNAGDQVLQMGRFASLCLVFMYGVISDSPVFALSCAPPTFDQMTIEKADIIFEGSIVSLIPGDSGLKKDGNYTEEALFEVTVPWKGVHKGDKVTILRNSYWGDRSTQDRTYLVVSRKETITEWFGLKRKTVYRAPHCKHTLHVPYTEENIATLKAYFAGSQR